MSVDLSSFGNTTPLNSITVGAETDGDDLVQPFTYTEWLVRIGQSQNDTIKYVDSYKRYVKAWESVIDKKKNSKFIVTDRYRTLLKNLTLNYTTDEEKRFLTNLDLTKTRHVESAVTFFSRKLKQIALYYSDARQQIRQNESKNTSIGTGKAIEHDIYSNIHRYIAELYISDQKIHPVRIAADSKTVVKTIDLFEVTDGSKTKKIQYDPQLFININQAIKNTLKECIPTLSITPGLTLDISEQIKVDQLTCEKLNYENFIHYIKLLDQLNELTLVDLLPRLTGADMWYLSGGSTAELISSDKGWRNIINRSGPEVKLDGEKLLKSIYEIGQIYTPQNIGILTYYSSDPKLEILNVSDEIEIIPNPNKFGSSTSSIRQHEDVTWVKADASNDGLFGDIIDDPTFPRFFGYRSDEENKNISYLGLCRPTDAYGFFHGPQNSKWKNEDVFPLKTANVYDIDSRAETLLVTDDTLVSWCTDVYGNEYGLYKKIKPRRLPEEFTNEEEAEEFDSIPDCVVIDGGETLLTRPNLWEDGVTYEIYDGGRAPGIDSKFEERPIINAHPDLRRRTQQLQEDGTLILELEPHNSWYYGPGSTPSGLELQPTSFHGFVYFPSGKADKGYPIYDQQAYCGLFTDIACGVIRTFSNCVIRDNYAFATFSDILSTIDDDKIYISSQAPREDQVDGFEEYLNTGYDVLTFDNRADIPVEIVQGGLVDGSLFVDEFCDDDTAEFEYQLDNGAAYFNDSLNVSKTKFAELPPDETLDLTTYQQSETGGRVVFRSYNSSVIADVSEVMKNSIDRFNFFKGSDQDIILNDIKDGNVRQMHVFNDVIYMQTNRHFYIEKINFDESITKINKSLYPVIIYRTASDEETQLEACQSPRHIAETNRLFCGNLTTFTVDDKKYVSPVINSIDLNNMQMENVYELTPENQQNHILTGTLSGFQYETADSPLLTYNKITDVYTYTYSCKLSSAESVVFATRIIDFEKSRDRLTIIDDEMHHCQPVSRYVSNLPAWKVETNEREIKFNPEEIIFNGYADTSYNIGLSSMNYTTGKVESSKIKGYQFKLNIDTGTLPVSGEGYKINQIIFDADDGSDHLIINRKLLTGGEPITFDIQTLPDQSDFGDPRIEKITHQYYFNNATRTSYTPTLTAVYANYKKLVISINFETVPYTIESAFDDVKLIDTKTYTNKLGESKQLLVYETQSPRYISSTTVTKPRYDNKSFAGYVDGKPYSGDYHTMSDGTIMTGLKHTPVSKTITTTYT